MKTLIELLNYGQSYWLDNLARKKITGGELQKRVNEQGLRGITSNPAIFNKAIVNSTDYDDQIQALVKQGKSPQQIYEALTVKDVQDACDILKPVYDQSNGTDGFVSLEVAPYLARDTQGTINEARRLFQLVGKANCLIKIPGTREGIPAIEQVLYEGIPVNITLLFSVARYEEIAHCYIRAMKRRADEGKPVNVASVASFFLSRIDTLVDSLLGNRIVPHTGGSDSHPDALMAKAAIASAKLAYRQFKKIFSGDEWEQLKQKGAHVQRPLWASTSSKNPLYSDVRYVETLIGADTVNTLPDETIAAFADHGVLAHNTIEQNVEEAEQLLSQLKNFDIDIDAVTNQLENEGIGKFIEPYNQLISNLADKRAKMLGDAISTQQISPGSLKSELNATYAGLDEKQAGRRLFIKDPYIWSDDAVKIKSVNNRLGWLKLPDNANELTEFAKQIKDDGYKHAVLLGMGGSSLCSEVARETFGSAEGFPELLVLDNTAPSAIQDIEKRVDIQKTLFIVASKSGGTAETLSFFKYYYKQLQGTGFENPGKNFVAITDDATSLVKTAEENHFRKVFINPGDIGGRYSVLSNFGLLPMALMGIDINAVLQSAQQMEASCDADIPVGANPGISLGAALGLAERRGRDKVTFIMSSSIQSFGYWVEQLIAESTGKEGRGLIPVTGEELGAPEVYQNDRVFVHMFLATDNNKAVEKKLAALEKAGHPVVRIKVSDKIGLGGEFYRWELATATAGIVIGINPFDEPNVAEGKKNTNDLLEEWNKNGSFKKATALLTESGIFLYGSDKIDKTPAPLAEFIANFSSHVNPGDYISILCYFMETGRRTKSLQTWRMQLRDKNKVATTLGYGPRYLHSTGQLHKGGPDTGVYIILASDGNEKLPIPGEPYGFGILHEAQSLGDFRSLSDKGRRVIYLQVGKNVDKGLKLLFPSLDNAAFERQTSDSV